MRHVILLTAFLAVLASPVRKAKAQGRGERQSTQQRLNRLREQINQEEQQLSKTKKQEEATLRTLENYNRKIKIRKELIENYRQRRAQLSTKLDSIQQSSDKLQGRVDALRAEYKQRAVHAYQQGRLRDLALILSARSINQMLVRARYLHRFAEQRRRQLDEIQQATRDLERRQQRLRRTQQQLDSLITETQSQREDLVGLQQDRQEVISDLRTRKQAMQADLEKKRKSASKLAQRVRKLMAAERQRRRTEGNAVSRARFEELSGSFEQNRGRLPWPSSGVITEPYGEITNPVYGTKTPNPGVLISTKASAPVQAIFEGRVFKVFTMPDFGTCAALSHGSYSSVYCNFSLTYVKEGQEVEAGEMIGRAGTKSSPKGSGVFFGLYDEEQSVDPMPWLADK